MSQVTEQSVRFQTALASIKLIQASAVLDLTEDDFDFLTSNKVWIATDRSRARRCVEACVYGTLDFVDRKSGSAGMPRPISYAVFCLKKKRTGERYIFVMNACCRCIGLDNGRLTRLYYYMYGY